MTEEQKKEELVLDQKQEEQKPEEQKQEEQKPEEQKQEEQKPEEQKQEEQKPEEQKQEEQKQEEQKQEEQKPEEQKPEEQKQEEQKPEEQKQEEQKQEEQKQEEQKPEEENQEAQEPKPDEEEKQEEQDEKELLEQLKNEALSLTTKEEDLFAGPYERLIDRKFIADPNYTDTKILPTENFNSEIKPKRQFYYKILITRPKREFEAPLNNLFQDKNSSEEQTVGNNEVKGVKSANEYPLSERSTIEMGFQTANSTMTKSFQVAKKIKINNYTIFS